MILKRQEEYLSGNFNIIDIDNNKVNNIIIEPFTNNNNINTYPLLS